MYALYVRLQDPQNGFFGPTFTGIVPGENVVALTFDDGPNAGDTRAILDVLAEERTNATFFVVGRAAARQPALLRRMVREGHALGNHTWSHAHLNVRTRNGIRRELSRTDDVIFEATGIRTKLVRPPFGARSISVLETIRSLGYTCVLWSVPLAREWERPDADTIARRILARANDGSIIALHDGDRGRSSSRGELADAVRSICRRLRERGMRFVTVPQMLSVVDERGGTFSGYRKDA